MKMLLLFLGFFCQLKAFESPTVFSPGYIREQMAQYKLIKALPVPAQKEKVYDSDDHKYHFYIYGKAETYENLELLKEIEPSTPCLKNPSKELIELDEIFSPPLSAKQIGQEGSIQDVPLFFVNPHPSVLLKNYVLRAFNSIQNNRIKVISLLTQSAFF